MRNKADRQAGKPEAHRAAAFMFQGVWKFALLLTAIASLLT